jgi:integrase
MALLVLDTGMRLNETLHLEVAEVDMERFLGTVRHAKRKSSTPHCVMSQKRTSRLTPEAALLSCVCCIVR